LRRRETCTSIERSVLLERAAARELHQLVARHRLPRVLRQRLQEREFARGERHRLALARERARGEVEREGAERDLVGSALGAPGVSAGAWRRSTALMRATSSRGLKGFAM
jgi:hypothetical protein